MLLPLLIGLPQTSETEEHKRFQQFFYFNVLPCGGSLAAKLSILNNFRPFSSSFHAIPSQANRYSDLYAFCLTPPPPCSQISPPESNLQPIVFHYSCMWYPFFFLQTVGSTTGRGGFGNLCIIIFYCFFATYFSKKPTLLYCLCMKCIE